MKTIALEQTNIFEHKNNTVWYIILVYFQNDPHQHLYTVNFYPLMIDNFRGTILHQKF